MNRRTALHTMSTGLGSVAFSAMATKNAIAEANPLAAKSTHFAPRAKHVIMLFMAGAPSHVDTFDYKPELIKQGGKRSSGGGGVLLAPQATFSQHGESGLWISDLFPHVSQHADDLCLLRGMHGDQPNHPPAERAALTGNAQFIRPSLGAWSVYGLGTENSDLPGFVSMGSSGRGSASVNLGSAFLPARYRATSVNVGTNNEQTTRRGGAVSGDGGALPNISNSSMGLQSQRTQLDLLKRLNEEAMRQDVHQPHVEGILQSYELAFRMQSSMPDLVDLSLESESTKEMYGIDASATSAFGTQCLMARRMVEAGVRYIQVGIGGWDHHTNIGQNLEKSCGGVDKPIAGLLADLKQRNLLEDTLVIWAGEFGRTPRLSGSGRGHNNKGYTTWMAGGGVKGGFSYGGTDEIGAEAVDGRMHTHDWHATILHLLGLDHEKLTYRHAGRDFRLTDVGGKVAKDVLA